MDVLLGSIMVLCFQIQRASHTPLMVVAFTNATTGPLD